MFNGKTSHEKLQMLLEKPSYFLKLDYALKCNYTSTHLKTHKSCEKVVQNHSP